MKNRGGLEAQIAELRRLKEERDSQYYGGAPADLPPSKLALNAERQEHKDVMAMDAKPFKERTPSARPSHRPVPNGAANVDIGDGLSA
jgi:hypothetical protein